MPPLPQAKRAIELLGDATFVPGTTNILTQYDHMLGRTDNDGTREVTNDSLKRSSNGVILLPQPTDSPNDPLNWSPFRKYYHFFLMLAFTALTAAISNDASASQESLNEAYGISYDAMNTGAGVLFLFIGWSCIFFAPASSLYGRRISYLICLLAGTLGSVWFGSSTKTADTIWSQAFVGMSESVAESQVQQSLSDIFFQHQFGTVLTAYIMATSIGTFLGPLIAHLISMNQGFRWVGWWGAIITGGCLALFVFSCEETVFDRGSYAQVTSGVKVKSSKIDDDEKEKNISKYAAENEESSIEGLAEKSSAPKLGVSSTRDVAPEDEPLTPYWKRIAIITPSPYLIGWGFKQYLKRFIVYFKVFTLPAVWLSGLLWGLQDTFMSFFLTTQDTYFYDDPWNKSETGVALMNIATLIGACIGCVVAGIISDKHVLWIAKRNDGVYEPEYRLYLIFITAVLSPVGLIMFGVGAAQEWPGWVVYGGLGLIGYGWGSVGDISMSYLMDCYPEIIIQGMVGVAIINNSLGAIFTFCCSYWLDSSGTKNTYIALAVIDFCTICFAIPTLIWGKSWRKWSTKLYLEMVELTQGM